MSDEMPGADHIRDVFQRYCELMTAGDADALTRLFAEDACIEDPVGSSPHRGREAIRAFYTASAGKLRLELEGRPRVAKNEGACAMRARPLAGGVVIETLDTMEFGEDGLVRSMRAYWSPATIRPE